MTTPMRRPWQRLLTPALAVSAMAVGIAALLAPREPIGWFAYAPLAEETFIPDQLVLMDTGARADTCLLLQAF
ncbi:hypothetical protein ACFRAU_14420 [Arthrobacter sp. NPDC056691]|uniref:hypothetical protein n=1 Tax=Arthrobacter sp. NPDC056691 TaxID=3345913 RepID=UPI00366DD7CD